MTTAMRSIEIALELNARKYLAGLGAAAGETKAFAREVTGMGSTVERDLKRVNGAMLMVGGSMVAGFGLAAGAAMRFDKTMSDVGAVSGATGAQLNDLRQAALDAGRDTVFSASEAAQAEAELAKAGVSTADILGGALTGALNLASAGNLDLARAAELSAQAMTTFGLHGQDVPHISDVLAAAANKSAAGVEDMGLAMSQTGLVAAQYGVSLEDTAGSLAMFAQSGLKGSDAGTSMKTMLLALNPQSQEAADKMRELGLNFYDAQGEFVGLEGAAGQLHDKLAGLTDQQRSAALQTIFGSDAIRGANILYQQGAGGVAAWSGKVNDAGYAAELARVKTDNLSGDLERLSGTLETGLIRSGESAQGTLRGMVQATDSVVTGMMAMPEPMTNAVTGIVGVGGAVLAAGGAVGTVLPKFTALTDKVAAMGKAGELLSSGMKSAAVGMTAAAPGLLYAAWLIGDLEGKARQAVAALQADWKPPKTIGEYGAQVNELIGAYDQLNAQAEQNTAMTNGWGVALMGLLGPIGLVAASSEELRQNANPFDENTIAQAQATRRELESTINQMLPGYQRWNKALDEISKTTGLSRSETQKLADAAGIDLRGAAGTLQTQLGLTAEQVQQLADKGVNLEGSIADDGKALLAYRDSLVAATPVQGRLEQSMSDMADSTKSAEDKLKSYKDQLDIMYGKQFGEQELLDRMGRELNELGAISARVYAEAGGDFNGMSDAAIAYRDHMRGTVQTEQDLLVYYKEHGIQGDILKEKMGGLGLSMLRAGEQAMVPRDVTATYLAYLNRTVEREWNATVTANTSQAVAAIGTVLGQLQHLGQTFTTSVGYGGAARLTGPDGQTYSFNMADGGVVSYYAGGGEHHVAQIAGAGDWRVWAEPETGGEAYIPLAVNKRPRSMQILSDVAHRFGVPLGGGAGNTVIQNTTQGDRHIHVHAPNYVGDKRELLHTILDELDRYERAHGTTRSA